MTQPGIHFRIGKHQGLSEKWALQKAFQKPIFQCGTESLPVQYDQWDATARRALTQMIKGWTEDHPDATVLVYATRPVKSEFLSLCPDLIGRI